MSLLNFTGNKSAFNSDILQINFDEETRVFRDYSCFEDFEKFFFSNLNNLYAEICHFDEEKASALEVKLFMQQSTHKFMELSGILKNLRKEDTLMKDVPKEFILSSTKRLTTIKNKLRLKRMSPENIAHLTLSKTLSSANIEEEDLDSLLPASSGTECEDNLRHLSKSADTEDRLLAIKSKYEYIQILCDDLATMASDQQYCIQSLETNYERALDNAKKGTTQTQKLSNYKERNNKQKCLAALIFLLVALFTVIYSKFGYLLPF